MTAIRRIPISVPPVDGEAIDSWLEALAHRTQTAWADLNGALGWPRDVVTGLSPQEAEDLHAATGVAVDQLHAMTLARYDGIALAIAPKTGRLDKKFPWHPRRGTKFCPECLAESGGRWSLDWRLTWTFACLKHRCLLAGSCPTCGRIPRHSPLPSELVPLPGRCLGRRPGAKPGVGSMEDRCHTNLGTAEVLHFDDRHPVLTAQRIVTEVIATGHGRFGIYANDPQSAPLVLADLRAIAGKVLAYGTDDDIRERLPADLFDAYQSNQPVLPDRVGNHPRTAFQPPADASTAAAGVMIALQTVMSATATDAAASLRWLVDRISTRRASSGSVGDGLWHNIGTSAVLAAAQSATPAAPKTIDKLRYGSPAGGRSYPEPSAHDVAAFAQKLPTLLWPPWSLPLTLTGHMHRYMRRALPVVILLQAYNIDPKDAAHQLNTGLNARQIARFLRLLTTHDRWPQMHRAIIEYTDWLRTAAIPIDYNRRRQIDYTDLLPDQLWIAMCRDTATPGRGPSGAGVVRDYLAERISGVPSPGGKTPERRTLIADCPFHLTPELMTALDHHALIFLKDKGIHDEPVVYHPPADLIDGLDLPGKDLLNINVGQLQTAAVASSMTRALALKRANITREAARYVLAETPIPTTKHDHSWAMRQAQLVLPPDRLYELHHREGQSLKAIGEAAGVSRQTITRVARSYGMPTRNPGRPVQHQVSHEWLYTQYIVENRTLSDIAEELGATASTVARWAKNYGIPVRRGGGASHKSALAKKSA
ncbi:MAG: TniQ family protein [Mycobacterium sp.]|nr:TniQ family protein [Mycobacterium sp.]